MKRTAGMWIVLAALGGCASTENGLDLGKGSGSTARIPATVPGVQGPWGQPVTVMQTGTANPSTGGTAVSPVVGLDPRDAGPSSGVKRADYRPGNGQPTNGVIHDHGMDAGMGMAGPGYGPGGGMNGMTGVGIPPGVVGGVGFVNGGMGRFQAQRTSVRFLRPEGMKVSWYVPSPDGRPTFTTTQLDVPGRYNFTQAAIYRLKLTHIPSRPNIPALYPTLEVAPATNKTTAFLAHSSVPVIFTEEDFDQVVAGNYLVKVIYLPDPGFQDVAVVGPDEIVSTRLDPGVNPVTEAQRRGSVLLIIRMGNIDLEAPNSPAMEAPNPYMMPSARPAPHTMNTPGKPMMAPQDPRFGSSTASPGQLPPGPRVLTPVPVPNSGPQVVTGPPDLPPAVGSQPQSAAPATTSQDPPSGTVFDRRPALRRRFLPGSGTDNQ